MTPMQSTVVKGATNQSVLVRFVQLSVANTPAVSLSEGTAGLVLKYWRDTNAFDVSIAPVSLTDLSSTWNAGGIKHIADGFYRVDVPNAAFAKATGVNKVLITATATAHWGVGALVTLVDGDRAPYAPTPQVY